jgi:hypothetical protein
MTLIATITEPALRKLPPTPDGGNPIHGLLDEVGLPWLEPCAALASRLGFGTNPIFQEPVVAFPNAVLVPGLLCPIDTRACGKCPDDADAALPPVWFRGYAWLTADARANIEQTAASLADRLGSTAIDRLANTLGGGWAAGPAQIRLTVFPPEWQGPGVFVIHDPRYREACGISIGTGYRLPLTEVERRWIDEFTAIGTLDYGAMTEQELRNTSSSAHALKYVREPPAKAAHLLRSIGHPAERQALIFCAEQLFVIPVAEIVGFRTFRMLPAKGPGSSSLLVDCRPPGGVGSPTSIRINGGREPDDMNGPCMEYGRLFDKPAVLGEYYPNM